jgi:hypothetical protein
MTQSELSEYQDSGDESSTALTNRKQRATYRTRKDGYTSWVDQEKELLVHRLLAIAEFGFDEVSGSVVHHKSNIPWDNRPENIEVMSKSEHHSLHSKGRENSQSKLTKHEVKEIKRLLEGSDKTHKEIGDAYGVSDAAITLISQGKTWSHIEVEST